VPQAGLAALLVVTALLLSSCATLPAARVVQSPWAALPSDGDLYLFADVQEARGLLQPLAAGFSGQEPARLDSLLDRVEQAHACLYLGAAGLAQTPPLPAGEAAGGAGEPPSGRGAELAVTGRFSSDLVSFRLSFSCAWVRHESAQPSAQPYWSARGRPLEVGSPAPGLLLVAAGRPGGLERMLARRLVPAAGPVERARASDPRVDPFLAGAALYAFLPGPPAGAGPGLPLRQVWLAARRDGEHYELGALAALAGEPSPRALASLVRLAAAAWLRRAGVSDVAGRLRALEIGIEGDALSLRGLRLGEAELLSALEAWVLPPAGEDAGAQRGD